ncbi:MAG TPA: alpha/beta hydrolase [Bacteroidetes bacterium]|nr:alpha/beta hydrolase [Bacteroidota bacterium]
MKIKLLTTRFGPLEYSDYGTGIPVLFLHGGHANARETMTHKFMDPAKFRLITPSRPGYGGTPLVNNETPGKAARQIIELMDALDCASFCVIGISAGGLTAIALAGLFPDRVRKLVLESAVTLRWLQPGDALYTKGRRLFNPKIQRFTWAMLRIFLRLFPRMIMRSTAKELTTVKIRKFTSEEVQQMKKMLSQQGSGSGFVTDLEQNADAQIIQQITAPTLIVHSKNDAVIAAHHPLNAQANICNSELIWVKNRWGHLLWLGEEAAGIIQPIVVFLLAQNQTHQDQK